jgi:hypothetical protein
MPEWVAIPEIESKSKVSKDPHHCQLTTGNWQLYWPLQLLLSQIPINSVIINIYEKLCHSMGYKTRAIFNH